MKEIKKIYEIGPEELLAYPVWVFPMDEDQYDEETLIPVKDIKDLNDHQIIVRSSFVDSRNNRYIGCIYWGEPSKVEYLQPCMFFDETGENGINFWNGMETPTMEEIEEINKYIRRDSFPIRYISETVFGLYQIEGILEGIYYLDSENNICVTKI